MEQQHLGRKIKKLRELRNFTQHYMAEQLGIAQPTYSKLENEQDEINEDKLQRIAQILDLNVSDILNFDDRAFLNIIQHNTIENQGYAYVHNNHKYSDDRVFELIEGKVKLLEKQVKLLEDKIESQNQEIGRLKNENELLKAKVK